MKLNFNRGIIQIAGIIDIEEAELLIECGVDMLGFPLRLPVNKEDCSEEDAAAIISKTNTRADSVLITYLNSADSVINLCRKINAKIVQLHGDIAHAELRKIKSDEPNLAVIKSLVIKNDNFDSLEKTVLETSELVDAFITDTFDPSTGASGATGKTHDWRLSRRLVELSPKPVILAGGINPENVFNAVCEVNPAGVDSHTGVENPDGRKSRKLVQKFAAQGKKRFR